MEANYCAKAKPNKTRARAGYRCLKKLGLAETKNNLRTPIEIHAGDPIVRSIWNDK
jgi:hypothetical protein